MKQRFLECGRIVAVHGLRGDVRVQPWGGSANELCEFEALFLNKGEQRVEVENARVQKNVVLLKLAGVDNVEQAQQMRGKVLYIDREQDSLAEGQFYVQDLLGMRVVDADSGTLYGELCDVTGTGANDVYHIRFADGSVKLAPAIPQVVLSVDPDGGEMRIRPLAGLFDDDGESF